MPWTQTDTSFKKLQNKRITTSTGKGIDEEKGASSLELYLPDVKTDLIPGTPPGASTSVLAYTGAIGQTFAVDTSVPSNLTWFATSGYGNTTTANDGSAGSENQRLGDWISDKYDAFGTVSGSGYEVKVYDKDSNLITKADPSDWLFDYQTGILVFNSASTAYGAVTSSGPFRVVGYRYIGQKGVISGSYGGSGFTTYTLGDLLVGAGSTLIKFPVGSDNYVLTADSSQPSGLRWAVGGGGGAGLTLNGLTASTQYFVTGTSGSGFNISSSGSTHTFNIPIAGAGATGLISTLAQTIAGQKTFTSAIIGDLSGIATTAGFATTADYAHQAGYAITSGFATTSGYAYQSGYAITSGLATTSTYSHQSGYAITSGLATTATYSHQSGYGITAGFATTSANINVSNASTGIFFPVLSNTSSSTSGIAASVNDFFSFNAANGAFGATSINIFTGQSYSIGGNSVLSSSSLGTGVTNSSLTALGIITTGTWSGSTITAYYGGTGNTTYTLGDLLVGAGSTFIKLPVGINSHVLGADSSKPSGVGWTSVTPLTISDTAPASPKNADLWFNSVDGGLLVYYSDVDTNQWVEIALGSGIDLSQPVHITSGVASTSTSTGALIVDGGAGFASTIYAPVISINGIYDQISSTITTSTTTADQVGLTLNATVYRTLKLYVQVTSSTSYHSQEIMMVHDGSSVYMSEYAIVNNGSILSTFDADISGGNIRLLVSPTNAVTTYKIACSAIRI